MKNFKEVFSTTILLLLCLTDVSESQSKKVCKQRGRDAAAPNIAAAKMRSDEACAESCRDKYSLTTPAPTVCLANSAVANDECPERPLEDVCAICGLRPGISPSIIGGQDAAMKAHPYLAILSIRYGTSYYLCGGSLISSSFVLTAAHCVDENSNGDLPDDVRLRLGRSTKSGDEPCSVELFAKDIIIHEDWNPSRILNDVALIEIMPMEYTDCIQPICLAAIIGDLNGEDAIAAGFGLINQTEPELPTKLQEGTIPIISPEECHNHYFTDFASFPDAVLCAHNEDTPTGTCSGDSGGPLLVDINNRKVQVGVTSFGRANMCIGSVPKAFANVTTFIPWIKENVKYVSCIGEEIELAAAGK